MIRFLFLGAHDRQQRASAPSRSSLHVQVVALCATARAQYGLGTRPPRLAESLSIGFGSGKIVGIRVAQGPHESEHRRSPGELIFPFAPTTVVDGCARPGCSPFT